jgi:hypothetical protein
VYDVECATEFKNYQWNYAALPNKPAAAALRHPFSTNLQELLKAGIS